MPIDAYTHAFLAERSYDEGWRADTTRRTPPPAPRAPRSIDAYTHAFLAVLRSRDAPTRLARRSRDAPHASRRRRRRRRPPPPLRNFFGMLMALSYSP